MENEFSVWLAEKIENFEFELTGQYYLDKLAKEEAKAVPANVEIYTYPRRMIIDKPLPYTLHTNTFPQMKIESKTVNIPIMGLAADIRISIDSYRGCESQYGDEWQDSFNEAMNIFMLELQNKAENGVVNEKGMRAGLWDNDQIVAKNSPVVLNPSKPLVTPEEGAKFIQLIDEMARAVTIASRHNFKANTMVIPAELESVFAQSIPQYGNMAGSNAIQYLKEVHNIDVYVSYNAKNYQGGQILVYDKDLVRYFMASPVEISQDDKLVIRTGNNLYFPIRGRFSGIDFKQPLSAVYFNHVLEPAKEDPKPQPTPPEKTT